MNTYHNSGDCWIDGDRFFTFLMKNGAFSSFFHFFVLFSSFAVFFVVRAQICAGAEQSEAESNIFVTRTQKRRQKMRKEQKSEKKMKRAPFFVKNRKNLSPSIQQVHSGAKLPWFSFVFHPGQTFCTRVYIISSQNC